jgi:hypothetical protein
MRSLRSIRRRTRRGLWLGWEMFLVSHIPSLPFSTHFFKARLLPLWLLVMYRSSIFQCFGFHFPSLYSHFSFLALVTTVLFSPSFLSVCLSFFLGYTYLLQSSLYLCFLPRSSLLTSTDKFFFPLKGGATRPEISHDGHSLAFVRRGVDREWLMVK